MAKHIGVDLGTANTLIYLKGKGVVLKEPSVVAVDSENGTVLAVGKDAKNMIGRTPDEVLVLRPLRGGAIKDFDVTEAMLRTFLEKACPSHIFRPLVTICVPYGITEVERRAVLEAVVRAGGKNAYIIDEPMAAALGAELPVREATGSMVVDIGGGTSEVAVISFGGIVSCTSVRHAGDKMDADILDYMKHTYNLIIGERTAEEIKIKIGSAHPSFDDKSMSVMGRDLSTGLPKVQTVTAEEIRMAMSKTIRAIVSSIKDTLETTPPELSKDIAERGIMLTGGGANIPGLKQLIFEETGIPVFVADEADECVVNGTGKALSLFLDARGKYKKPTAQAKQTGGDAS